MYVHTGVFSNSYCTFLEKVKLQINSGIIVTVILQ